MSSKPILFVGPAIRRPLDPDQNARNVEAVLKVADPASVAEINILKCTRISWERLSDQKCTLACEGYLIAKNQELLERISGRDVRFTWRLASTAGMKTHIIGRLQAIPDFSSDVVRIVVEYDPRSDVLPSD